MYLGAKSDEGRYGADEFNSLHNLVAALFRLETQRSLADVRIVVDALIEWLAGEDQRSMRRAFAIWIKRMLRSQLPGAAIDGMPQLPAETLYQVMAGDTWDWSIAWRRRTRAIEPYTA